MKRTSKEIKRIARDILNNRYTIPMGAFVTASLIPAVIEIPFSLSGSDYPTTIQVIIFLLAEYLIMLIGLVLNTGVAQVHLNMTRKLDYKLSQIFGPFRAGFERFMGAAFLLSILSIFCTIPLILGAFYFNFMDLTALSVCILVLTGILSVGLCIILAVNYMFVPYFLLDCNQMKVLAAFQECRLMMKGNKKRLFLILLSFIGYSLLILCSFGIAALWAGPYMTQTMITFYLDCTGELDRIPVRDDAANTANYQNPF